MAKERTPLQYLIGGAVGGLSVVLVGHPFDTIKVQLQMSPGVYKGMFHVARTLIAKEGPFSLYKGITAPLAVVVPFSAMGFFSFGAGKLLISQPGQTKLSGLQLLFAGMFSGACTTIVAAPGERIKCLLQAQNKGPKKYKGFFDCAQKLLKEGGIRNLYLGTCATLLRDMPSCATYFYCYERIMEFLLGNSTEITWQPLLAGGTAGIATWLVSLPADSMKTRLQISPMGTYPRGVRSIFPIIMKEGGILGLYRGVVPVLIRAFIANAACFYSLELAFNIMDKYIL
ncbi:PREDICTED: congested-like trachea protein [Polistes canadensis]|uniref:congested-like trachea protein n=1 Tax=Polistes canadensis TaxID=91411 RepID=UPI000718B33B|nr:PREDICTED: congested-like trachea protein [Polistes canadensis]